MGRVSSTQQPAAPEARSRHPPPISSHHRALLTAASRSAGACGCSALGADLEGPIDHAVSPFVAPGPFNPNVPPA